MLNIKVIFFALFICFNLSSQVLEKKTSKDTIYIVYNENEKTDGVHLKLVRNKTNESYQYIFNDSLHIDFRCYTKEMLSKHNIFKNKSFLKNKKIKILYLKDFQEYGYSKLTDIFSNRNLMIYFIDKKKIKKNKILLKRGYYAYENKITI